MIESLIKATNLELYKKSAEPFAEPMPLRHAIIVGGIHLRELEDVVTKYALETTVIIPTTLPSIDMDYETERAIRFEIAHEQTGRCRNIGHARDFSAVNTDSADMLIISTQIPGIREEFLSQAWRVTKELSKVVIFSQTELPLSYLVAFGLAAPRYFTDGGFYVGTMRKIAARLRQN